MGWWTGEPMCQGDEGADVMDIAIEKLNSIWNEAWNRNIRKDEILELVEFCFVDDDDNQLDTSVVVEE
mgnify:CR=1 FL=1